MDKSKVLFPAICINVTQQQTVLGTASCNDINYQNGVFHGNWISRLYGHSHAFLKDR